MFDVVGRCWLHSIPSPVSLLCRRPLQSYAVTRYKCYAAKIGRQNILRAGGVFGDKRRFSQFLKTPYLGS
jgi:hypothetical protein